MAAYDMYIKPEGIDGDSTAAGHENWIRVESCSNSFNQAAGGDVHAEGFLSGGKVDFDAFTFTKRIDKASPLLAERCCTGQYIPRVEFECCRATGTQQKFWKITFTNVLVTSITHMGSEGGDDVLPLEEVSFRFTAIDWEQTPTDATGAAQAPLTAGWDLAQNKKR